MTFRDQDFTHSKAKISEPSAIIPHRITELTLDSDMPTRPRRLYDVIIRKTFGWNKTKAIISRKEFVDMTRIDGPNVNRELNKLLKFKRIVRDNQGAYSINDNKSEWLPWITKRSQAITNSLTGETIHETKTVSSVTPKDVTGDAPSQSEGMSPVTPNDVTGDTKRCHRRHPLYIIKEKKEILKKPPKEKMAPPSPEALKLTEIFLATLPEEYKKRISNQNQWPMEFDKMLKMNYKFETIEAIILKYRNDDFWKKNFLSPAKLLSRDGKEKVRYIDRWELGLNETNNYRSSHYNVNPINHIPVPTKDADSKPFHIQVLDSGKKREDLDANARMWFDRSMQITEAEAIRV